MLFDTCRSSDARAHDTGLRRRIWRSATLLIFVVALATSCGDAGTPAASGGGTAEVAGAGQSSAESEPLASWNEGPAKRAIAEFVGRVTNERHPDFVPPEDRIATFDNDGTLWAEKPLYFQFAFVIDRVHRLAPQHPEWSDEQPFKAILEGDAVSLHGDGAADIAKLLTATQAGMTQTEYAEAADAFLRSARHPRFDALYTELVYQPMLELLDYLRSRGFDIHIVSGGTVEFIRAYSNEVYGIPPQSVVGSSFAYEFRDTSGIPEIFRMPELAVFNDEAVKPASIELHIGKVPILAFGNSDGDLQMLEYTDNGAHPALSLLLHHDDAEREYAYDEGAENALQAAAERGWTVVSIKEDFARVFPGSGQ